MTNKIDETVEIPNVTYPDSGTRREAIADGWWWVIISKGHNAEPMRKHLGEIWGGCGHYQDYDFFKQFPHAKFLAPIPPPASLAAMREAISFIEAVRDILDTAIHNKAAFNATELTMLRNYMNNALSALSTTPPAPNDDGLAKLLKEIEWKGDVYEMDGQRFEVCPLCEQDKDDGHSPDCSLARWIAKAEAGK